MTLLYHDVFRQIGLAGLGPDMLYVEQDREGEYWGLMVMEELPDGGFANEFDSSNVTQMDMSAMGSLLGKIHMLPTKEVSGAACLAKTLLLEHGMDQQVVEELYQSRGGYFIFLILWWKKLFPEWMAKNSPINHPLPPAYVERFLNIIIRVGRIKPLTSVMGKLGFSHSDMHHANLMRKGEKVVAIDCETASTGPALLDLGGIVWNGRATNGIMPYIDRSFREALVLSFYQAIGEECRDMESALYDLELGSLYRLLWAILCSQFMVVGKSLEIVEKVGGVQMEKCEVMASALERAVDDKELMRNILNQGGYWPVRDKLSVGHEECIRDFVSI